MPVEAVKGIHAKAVENGRDKAMNAVLTKEDPGALDRWLGEHTDFTQSAILGDWLSQVPEKSSFKQFRI